MIGFHQLIEGSQECESRACRGTVDAVRGMTMLAKQLKAPVGAVVRIERAFSDNDGGVRGEVIGFDGGRAIVMLLGNAGGTGPGDRVLLERASGAIMVGDSWLGRVLDGLGRPIDGKPHPSVLVSRNLFPPASNPM